ncbi:MAG: hypothetical protein K2V71_06280 [Methylotenera sp.]|nr:hypothetical protein [Methylotenera sp.]
MDALLRNEINSYIKNTDVVGMLSVSLTLKQRSHGERLDNINTSQNFRHFMNILNTKVYGKQFKRFQKRIRVLPVIEISKDDRYHYHLIMDVPKHTTAFWLSEEIINTWKKTKFGYRQVDIKQITDDGWTDYITKFKSKDDQVDWVNVHWN